MILLEKPGVLLSPSEQREENEEVSKQNLARFVKAQATSLNISIRKPGPAENLGAVGAALGLRPGVLLDILAGYQDDKVEVDRLVSLFRMLDKMDRDLVEVFIKALVEFRSSSDESTKEQPKAETKFLDKAHEGFKAMRDEELREREAGEDQTDQDNEIGTGS
jgi:hypothetical protein